VLVVAAAGNGGLETVPFDEDIPVLVVGASDRHDRVWEMSNRDQRTLFAPGVEILATWSDARYAKSDGTSFAAPVVAAGAAMLMAHGMEAEDVRERLVSTAVDIGAGLGRVDLAAAAGVTDQPPPIATPPPTTPPPADPPPTEAQPPGSAPPPGQPTAMPATPVPVEPVPVTEPEPAPPQASPTPPPPVASPTPPPVLTPGPLSSSTPPAAAVPPEPTAALPAEPDPLPVERVPGGGLPGGARAGVVVAVAVLVVDVAALGAWLVARRRAGAGP